MSTSDACEVLIVGGGKAGKTLAADLARSGHRVALVDGWLPFTARRDGILAHPTRAEGLDHLFGAPLK